MVSDDVYFSLEDSVLHKRKVDCASDDVHQSHGLKFVVIHHRANVSFGELVELSDATQQLTLAATVRALQLLRSSAAMPSEIFEKKSHHAPHAYVWSTDEMPVSETDETSVQQPFELVAHGGTSSWDHAGGPSADRGET